MQIKPVTSQTGSTCFCGLPRSLQSRPVKGLLGITCQLTSLLHKCTSPHRVSVTCTQSRLISSEALQFEWGIRIQLIRWTTRWLAKARGKRAKTITSACWIIVPSAEINAHLCKHTLFHPNCIFPLESLKCETRRESIDHWMPTTNWRHHSSGEHQDKGEINNGFNSSKLVVERDARLLRVTEWKMR